MNVSEVFDKVSQRMQSDFEEARIALDHPGLKGNVFEEIFKKFLRKYLPRSLDISTGKIVDSKGKVSKQLDVIASDFAKTPILYEEGEVRILPVECVYSVIEVKAKLDGKEINSIFENMLSVRALQKIAYKTTMGPIKWEYNVYGKEWDILPINYFVFAFDSIDLGKAVQEIQSRIVKETLPEFSRIDSICVLNKGVICNKTKEGKFSALPEKDSTLVYNASSRALLLFYTLISEYLCEATMPSFRFTPYLGQMTFE